MENGSGHNVVAVFIVSFIDEDTLTVALVPLRPSYSWEAAEVEVEGPEDREVEGRGALVMGTFKSSFKSFFGFSPLV